MRQSSTFAAGRAVPATEPVQQFPADNMAVAAKRELYPWETPPDLLAGKLKQIAEGNNPKYPVRGDETLNALEYIDLRSKGLKLDLHLLDGCVAVTEHEPLTIPLWLWYLIRIVLSIIAIPFCLASLGFVLVFLGPVLLVAAVILGVVYMAFASVVGGPVALLMVLAILVAIVVGITLLFHNSQWAAKVIRANPGSWLAIRLLYSKTPLVPRVFCKGDVVQLICAHPKTGWFSSRSLLVFVQDRPAPRQRLWWDRLIPRFFARRRIYYVWFDGGEKAAEDAAKHASGILGLEITRAIIEKRKGMVIP